MSKSIRISDELAAHAEAEAKRFHRSPPQQIEHWAEIGRILEPALSYRTLGAVKEVSRRDLDAALAEVGTPAGRKRAREVIDRTSGTIVSSD